MTVAEKTYVGGPAPGAAAAGAASLIVAAGGAAQEYALGPGALIIGRDPASDIPVDDPKVSRRHAEVRPAAGGYEIVDAGSANGLFLGTTKVERRALADGDVLRIGRHTTLTYRSGAPPPARVELGEQTVLTVGRDPENAIVLDHPSVSARQVAIMNRGGQVFVEDAGSSSDTYVNAQPLARGELRPLQPGDIVQVGPTKFVVAGQALQRVDESRDIRLDALHLQKTVAKGRNLLQDISLAIEPQEFVAIVGVSGAGKSTLLDALNGFRRPTEGRVLVNGTDLYRNYDAYRSLLGYVPQDDTIHKELTVYEALDYAGRLRLPADTRPAERRARVEEVMETLGLTERRDVPIQRLSGGQRKRVCIGTELLTQPGLFYLDEATSGLDPGTESQMMRLLRRLADEGHTVLLVTHATKNVMLCDQAVFLAKGGHLAYYGPPEEALAYFGVPDFDAIYEKLEGELSPEEWGERYRRSAQYEKFVVDRLQSQYGALVRPPPARPGGDGEGGTPAAARAPARRGRRVSGLLQFRIMAARYLRIIARDRVNLGLLFLVAPLLASIDLIAWPRDVLDPRIGDASRALTMLFMAALIPFLVGSLSSVREIVKESAVYRRERTVGLGVLPYLLSKISVGFIFALYHAGALLALKLAAVDLGSGGTDGIIQVYVTIALAAMSGVMWGLVISTLAPREEQAMLMVIIVVVVQMVFSGGLVALGEIGPIGQGLGSITSSKWAFQALATATQVKSGDCVVSLADCRLPGIQLYATDPERAAYLKPIEDRFGGVFGEDVLIAWLAMGAIIAGLCVALYVLQKRKDVI
ncbi:MAG: ATP-binding cassette domain-containing protein [Dehalococcoidia bacterium]|nr:ATP-binding cassette domain-containing protein [Dehalococcoidia bacterium]